MSKFIALPDGNYVNPAHVTAIELKDVCGTSVTTVWVARWCGVDALCFSFVGDRRVELATLIGGSD